jgi:hypothetical protein
MTRDLSAYDPTSRLRELRERGWCAFEGALGASEIHEVERLLRDFVAGLDPSRLAGFGATIFALAAREPRLYAFFHELAPLGFLERALEDRIAFRRTGARISGKTSQPRIIWHHHHGWGAEALAERTAFERLLFICYLQGTDRAHGPLIVKPRDFGDPFQEAPEERFQPLAGEVQLEYPPGTIVVMDAPVLHSALRGTGDDLRVILGAHVQPSGLVRAHPEDDPPIEKARVNVRHRSFRWGLRDGKRWLEKANRAPLPEKSSY